MVLNVLMNFKKMSCTEEFLTSYIIGEQMGESWVADAIEFGFEEEYPEDYNCFSEKKEVNTTNDTYKGHVIYENHDGTKRLSITDQPGSDIGKKLVMNIHQSNQWKIAKQVYSESGNTKMAYEKISTGEILVILRQSLEKGKSKKFTYILYPSLKKLEAIRKVDESKNYYENDEEVYLCDGVYVSKTTFDLW